MPTWGVIGRLADRRIACVSVLALLLLLAGSGRRGSCWAAEQSGGRREPPAGEAARDGEEEWTLAPPGITHLGMVEDLVNAVRDGRPNCLPGEEGRKTSAVIEAAERSSREKRVAEVK